MSGPGGLGHLGRNLRWRLALAIGALALALLAVGCAPVKTWDREILARDDMKWDPDEVEATRMSHVHFAKEGTLLGGGAGGGGCGCN